MAWVDVYYSKENTNQDNAEGKKINLPDLREQILLWDYHLCLAQSFAPLGMHKVQGLPLEGD